MPLHGLTAPRTCGRLAQERVGRGIHLVLQGFPHAGAVLDPPLPVPATCTARLPAKPDAAGPPRVVRPADAADAAWPRATCFPRAAATTSLGCTMAPAGRMALFSPRLIKQKTA